MSKQSAPLPNMDQNIGGGGPRKPFCLRRGAGGFRMIGGKAHDLCPPHDVSPGVAPPPRLRPGAKHPGPRPCCALVWWLNLSLGAGSASRQKGWKEKRTKPQPCNFCRSPPQKTNACVVRTRKGQIGAQEWLQPQHGSTPGLHLCILQMRQCTKLFGVVRLPLRRRDSNKHARSRFFMEMSFLKRKTHLVYCPTSIQARSLCAQNGLQRYSRLRRIPLSLKGTTIICHSHSRFISYALTYASYQKVHVTRIQVKTQYTSTSFVL